MASVYDWFNALGPGAMQVASDVYTIGQQKSLMRENQRWQESMMDKQNAYNSPAAQRSRAIAAGAAPNFAPMGSAGVESVSQPNLKAPDFTAFGDPAAKIRNADLQNAEIKSQEMANYRSGVDNQLYLQEKMIKIASSLEELRSQGLNNREAEQRYDEMVKRFEMFQDTYDALVEREFLQNENINQSTVKMQEDVKAEWQKLDNELKSIREMIRHNKVAEALAQFANKTDRMNAITNRMNAGTYGREASSVIALNEQQQKHVEQLTKEAWFRNYVENHTVNDKIDIVKFQRKMAEYDMDERKSAMIVAAIEADWARNKSASFIGNALRSLTGMDPDEVFSAAMMIGLGYSAASRARSAAKSVPKDRVAEFNGYDSAKGVSRSEAESVLGRTLDNIRGLTGH